MRFSQRSSVKEVALVWNNYILKECNCVDSYIEVAIPKRVDKILECASQSVSDLFASNEFYESEASKVIEIALLACTVDNLTNK